MRAASDRRYHVFADESAISPPHPCYGIGALVVPTERLDAFNDYVTRRMSEHGLVGEAKWKKVDSSHGLINFTLQLWRDVLNHPFVRFAVIVVRKDLYQLWSSGQRERAFYTTYAFLLRHAARLRAGEFSVFIDDRSDSYDKQDEVLGIVSNHMLRNLGAESEIAKVAKSDSKYLPGLQVVDLFTGAITHAHACRLNSSCDINAGKQLLVERMAGLVGWPDLYCDTMPDSSINIWHFPVEWRATPETRTVRPANDISFVTATELAERRKGPVRSR